MTTRFITIILTAFIISVSAVAVEPNEVLKDKSLENRARNLSKGLRCLVCQNQSIDDSNADLARDLRVILRERLKAGDSDKEVIGFIVARYGEFVLLDPPVNPRTALLWGGPGLILLISGISLALWFRRRNTAMAEELSEIEKESLVGLLEGKPDRREPDR